MSIDDVQLSVSIWCTGSQIRYNQGRSGRGQDRATPAGRWGRRRTMKVVLAEKPSVAREIAAVLGADARRDGYYEGRGYQVTWALGHLVMLKEPEDYDPALKKWSLDTLPIVPERFGLKR